MESGFNNIITAAAQWSSSLQIPSYTEKARTETMFFQCEVMFGSPSSNCGGNGICKIVAKNDHPFAVLRRSSCSHARAFFAASDNGKGAALLFRREWLCANLMRRHFRHGILEMPEPCPIPAGIATTLGLKIKALPAGLHLMEDCGAFIRINFLPHTEVI
ncbi:MAG: hypothetical protein DYG98_17695 [Haliscomenobacteraceae bacterium CHB4]|nr:hypothetical protein [Saprospiraceae bacterium]MCE7924888.1 hypothetical protein [Haliscomenobacteraceae bacterium CHB4]